MLFQIFTVDKPEILVAQEDIDVFKVCLINHDIPGTALPYFKSDTGIVYSKGFKRTLPGIFNFITDDYSMLQTRPEDNHCWVLEHHDALFYSFSMQKCGIGKPYDPDKIAQHMFSVTEPNDVNEIDFFHLPAIPEQGVKERIPCFVKCIVPKGSKYYEGISGIIVSDTIEVVEIISVDEAFKKNSGFRKTKKTIFVI